MIILYNIHFTYCKPKQNAKQVANIKQKNNNTKTKKTTTQNQKKIDAKQATIDQQKKTDAKNAAINQNKDSNDVNYEKTDTTDSNNINDDERDRPGSGSSDTAGAQQNKQDQMKMLQLFFAIMQRIQAQKSFKEFPMKITLTHGNKIIIMLDSEDAFYQKSKSTPGLGGIFDLVKPDQRSDLFLNNTKKLLVDEIMQQFAQKFNLTKPKGCVFSFEHLIYTIFYFFDTNESKNANFMPNFSKEIPVISILMDDQKRDNPAQEVLKDLFVQKEKSLIKMINFQSLYSSLENKTTQSPEDKIVLLFMDNLLKHPIVEISFKDVFQTVCTSDSIVKANGDLNDKYIRSEGTKMNQSFINLMKTFAFIDQICEKIIMKDLKIDGADLSPEQKQDIRLKIKENFYYEIFSVFVNILIQKVLENKNMGEQ